MSDIPEQVSVIAETNGPQGGDTGHGGYTSVTFSENGGGNNTVAVRLRSGHTLHFDYDEWASVTITASGDWEGCGLHIGMRNAADTLEPAWAEYSGRFEANMAKECAEAGA